MSVFIDTSAFLAVLDADDAHHEGARKRWTSLLEAGEPMFTSSYVLVEMHALAQSRLGLAAVRSFVEDVVPAIRVHWVDEADHRTAVASLLTAARRKLSLVDCASFVVMRRLGVMRAFAYDRHFAEQGFETLR